MIKLIQKYFPVILTLILVLGLGAYTSFLSAETFNIPLLVNQCLGFFFLIFGFFKILDIKGFVAIFRQYDMVAKFMPPYAFLYPFIEIMFGICFLGIAQNKVFYGFVFIFLCVREIGIVRTTLDRQTNISCGCMGTTALFPINNATILANIVTLGAVFYLLVH